MSRRAEKAPHRVIPSGVDTALGDDPMKRHPGRGRGTVERRGEAAALLVAALLACSLLLSLNPGCGGDNTGGEADAGGEARPHAVPLSTVLKDIYSAYGTFDEIPLPADSPPRFEVITSEEDLKILLWMLFAYDQPEVDVDLGQYVVIAAMQGPKNTAGYSITVTEAVQQGREVTVTVKIEEPEPDSFTAQVFTSPYHLVKAERSAFYPRDALDFRFVDEEGRNLSSIEVSL
jgi:hypothetical protein